MLSLKGLVPMRKTNGYQLVKAVEVILGNSITGPMIQGLDLGNNASIEDTELAQLTQSLTSLTKRGSLSNLKHLSLSSIGASASAICNLFKALPKITRLRSLDVSGNSIAFFCADALASSLKTIESMPKSSKRQDMESYNSYSGDDFQLLKLNLSGTKIDELSAYQLCLGII